MGSQIGILAKNKKLQFTYLGNIMNFYINHFSACWMPGWKQLSNPDIRQPLFFHWQHLPCAAKCGRKQALPHAIVGVYSSRLPYLCSVRDITCFLMNEDTHSWESSARENSSSNHPPSYPHKPSFALAFRCDWEPVRHAHQTLLKLEGRMVVVTE